MASVVPPQEDDPMRGSEGEEEDAEGENVDDDSSEEEDDNPDEERRIREGFIVDEEEDEDEDEDDEREERKRKRKKRKRHHRREEVLEEDDLELLEENTGASFRRKGRLTRLRRGRDSESPPIASSSRHRAKPESSEDDLDDDAEGITAQDIHAIFDDERGDDDDDIDSFIETDDEDGGVMDEASREERRREKKRAEVERRKMAGLARTALAGIDANAWEEIHEVFGDGHDYDWALEAEDESQDYEDAKQAKYTDLFEPDDIRSHLMTEDDDLIRVQDIPERMQLATSTLSSHTGLSIHAPLTPDDLNDAAMWITMRLSTRKTHDFFNADGEHQHLKAALVMAVTFVIRSLFIDHLEVPYIWTHKRDHISHFDVTDMRARFELLSQSELWRIHALGQKYRSFLTRRRALQQTYERLQVEDKYFEEDMHPEINNIEMVADASEWLAMKYKSKKPSDFELNFNEDEENELIKKHKMPSRISAYEVTKKSIVSRLVKGFGINSHEIVLNFIALQHVHFVEDQEVNPIAYAEQFVDPDAQRSIPAEELLNRARMLLAHELGKDPLLREHVRQKFKEDAYISIKPTARGILKIDDYHPYFAFKYLHNKPLRDLLDSPMFMQILKAESEHLVTVSIYLENVAKSQLERRLNDAFTSDSYSDSAKAWNEERSRVIQEVLDQHLIPAGVKWTREYVREEVEDYLATRCYGELKNRIDVAPFATSNMKEGDVPTVFAISWGQGNPQKDAIHLVYLDEGGRMREAMKIDNLFDNETQKEFVEALQRRKPDIIAIAGLSMATTKLAVRIREIVTGKKLTEEGWVDANPEEALDIPVVYVPDDVARVYQHSPRALREFASLPQTARYCVALARYAQSPLNEIAAMGPDLVTLKFEDDLQTLIPPDKMLLAFERALVDVVAKVGVDINRAVNDEYHKLLLPYVSGLGPRKAKLLVSKIQEMGGNLTNRLQFIKAGLLTTKVFLNAAGFLRIPQEETDAQSSKQQRNRPDDDSAPDPLDDTRVHPEDYDLARKMASDALELDEEDLQDYHPSHVVTQIMADPDGDKKLADLNLDEFAVSLYEASEDKKRHTLNLIREELRKPFAEQRRKFESLGAWDILTMLSGETPKTLSVGLIISVAIKRITPTFVQVRLDSGIDGVIHNQYLAEAFNRNTMKDQTIRGVVIHVTLDADREHYLVELSSRETDVSAGDLEFRRPKYSTEYWDYQQHEKDQELLERKKRAQEIGKARRIIKHPNFHNFDSAQAEAYLEKQQRGDVVIRPSSKGINHLAVTWKVDDKLYQHIDVTDSNPDPTGQSTGGQLIVDANHTYADLDELIVNHVQAMARRVEELMAHERYKPGSEDELHLFLRNQLAANPCKSMYGFTLNRKKPGHFNLGFLANKNSTVQTWPVRVTPEAYYLFEASAVGVPELCDAFKVRHLHESQNFANAAAGGKTPFGSRTPARPGHATPGRTSVRQIGRTPNPYGGTTPARNYPQSSSTYSMPTPYGYQTPSHNQRPLPYQMNPERASLMQQDGWGQGNTGW